MYDESEYDIKRIRYGFYSRLDTNTSAISAIIYFIVIRKYIHYKTYLGFVWIAMASKRELQSITLTQDTSRT